MYGPKPSVSIHSTTRFAISLALSYAIGGVMIGPMMLKILCFYTLSLVLASNGISPFPLDFFVVYSFSVFHLAFALIF